jgi:hypothetical protein
MPDPIMVPYKWLEILDQEPIEDGGKALNNNFSSIADYNGPSVMGPGAPTVDDDITQGFFPWSKWFDTDAGKQYVCLDNTAGAAVWETTDSDVAPADPDTAVQFNNGGEFGGSEDFTFDDVGVTLLRRLGVGIAPNLAAQIYVYTAEASQVGVYGWSDSYYGLYGRSGTSYGVYGYSTSGQGVRGYSDSGVGVYGRSVSNYSGFFQRDGTEATVPVVSIQQSNVGDLSDALQVKQAITDGYLLRMYADLSTERFTVDGNGNVFLTGAISTVPGSDLVLESGTYQAYLDGTTGEWVCPNGITDPDGVLDIGPDVHVPGHLGVNVAPNSTALVYAYTLEESVSGVYGFSLSYRGVYGASSSGYGGIFTSTEGVGVYGSSTNNAGVSGYSGTSYAGYFVRNSAAPTTPCLYASQLDAGDSQDCLRLRRNTQEGKILAGYSGNGALLECALEGDGDLYLRGGDISTLTGTNTGFTSGSFQAYLDGTTGEWVCPNGIKTEVGNLELGPDVYIPGSLGVGITPDGTYKLRSKHTTGVGMRGDSTDSIGVYGVSTNYVGSYGTTNTGWYAGYFYRNGLGPVGSATVYALSDDPNDTQALFKGQHDGTGKLLDLIGASGTAKLGVNNDGATGIGGNPTVETLTVHQRADNRGMVLYGYDDQAAEFISTNIGSSGQCTTNITGHSWMVVDGIAYWYSKVQLDLQYGQNKSATFFRASGANPEVYVYGDTPEGERWGKFFVSSAGAFWHRSYDGKDSGLSTGSYFAYLQGSDGMFRCDGGFRTATHQVIEVGGNWQVTAPMQFLSKVGIGQVPQSIAQLYCHTTEAGVAGVYGYSDASYGIRGGSQSGYGCYGHSTDNAGVYGYSNNNAGVYGVSVNSYGGYFLRTTPASSPILYAQSFDATDSSDTLRLKRTIPEHTGYFTRFLIEDNTDVFTVDGDGNVTAESYLYNPGVVSFVHPKNTDAGLWFVALMDGSKVDLTQNLKIILTWIYNGATTDTVEFGVQGSIIQNGQAVPAGGISLSGAVTPGNNIVNTTEIDVDLSGAPTTGPFQFSFKVYRNRSGANDTLNADVNSLAYFSQAYFKGE